MNARFPCPVCGATAWERTAVHYYASADDARPRLSAYQALRRRVLFDVWLPEEDALLPGTRRLAAVVCRACGYGSAAPRPDDADVTAKYEFLVRVEGESGASAHDAPGLIGDAQRAQRTADALLPFVPADHRSVIDVGGGDGKLLGPFRDAGLQTYLVDYNPHPLPGVERIGSTLNDVPIDRKFGAAVLSHVLEHAAEPLALLGAARQHLVPGGAIYIEVPSEHWGGLPIAVDPVTHVGFFTPATLELALRRAGFDVLTVAEGPGSYGGAMKGVITAVGRAGTADADASPAADAGVAALRRTERTRATALAKSRLARRRPPVRTLIRGFRREQPTPIVVMTDVYPKISETFIVNEVRALERLGHPVVVESRARPAETLPLDATDATAHYMHDDGRRTQIVATAWLVARHPAACLRDLRRRGEWRREEAVVPLRRIAPVAWRIRRSGAERIHVHFAAEAALNALRVGSILGIRWSLTAHAYDIFMLPANLREKMLAADRVTTGCDYNVDYLASLLPDSERGRVHKIIMGVDPDEFVRSRPRPNRRRVIAVGRLVEKKGFAYLIEAAGILRARGEPIELTIVGNGPLRDELGRVAERAGVAADVRFAGALAPLEVKAELEAADVLVCPCIIAADGDRDSMPVVVKEAMAMELPVVGTAEVGLPEMIGPDRGRLAPPADAAALADAIAEVLALADDERAALGAAGRAWVSAHADVVTETRKLVALLTP